jgi:hypothetical protein
MKKKLDVYMHDLMRIRAQLIAYERVCKASEKAEKIRSGEVWMKVIGDKNVSYANIKKESLYAYWYDRQMRTYRKTYFIDATRYFKLFLPQLTRIKMGLLFDEWAMKVFTRKKQKELLPKNGERLFPLSEKEYNQRKGKIKHYYTGYSEASKLKKNPSYKFHRKLESLYYLYWNMRKS